MALVQKSSFSAALCFSAKNKNMNENYYEKSCIECMIGLFGIFRIFHVVEVVFLDTFKSMCNGRVAECICHFRYIFYDKDIHSNIIDGLFL